MARSSKKDPQGRLTDVEVLEVSQVDRAANARKYLVVKSEDAAATEEQPPVVSNDSTTPTAPELPAPAPAVETSPAPQPEPAPSVDPVAPVDAALPTASVTESSGTPAIETVEKRGAKMAKDRFDRMKSAVDALAGIVAELQAAEGELEGGSDATKLAKSDEPNPLELRVVELEKSAANAAETIRKQAEEIAAQKVLLQKRADALAASRIATSSNSREPEEHSSQPAKPFCWGHDLNERA